MVRLWIPSIWIVHAGKLVVDVRRELKLPSGPPPGPKILGKRKKKENQ